MCSPVILTPGETDLQTLLSALRANAQFYQTKTLEALELAKRLYDDRAAVEKARDEITEELVRTAHELKSVQDQLRTAVEKWTKTKDELEASRENEQRARDERDGLWSLAKRLGASLAERDQAMREVGDGR